MDQGTLKSISIVFHRSFANAFCANIFELHYNAKLDGRRRQCASARAHTQCLGDSVLMIVISEITRCDKNNRSNECENNCLTEIRSRTSIRMLATGRVPNGNRCFSTLRNTSSRVYIFQHFMEIVRPYFDLTSTLSLSNAIEKFSSDTLVPQTPTPMQNAKWSLAICIASDWAFLFLIAAFIACQMSDVLLFSKWLQTISHCFLFTEHVSMCRECEYFRNDLFVPFGKVV